MENVTKGPTSHTASLQQEPSQCVGMWWSEGREREVEQLEHREERGKPETQGWRGGACCKWAALPLWAMMRSQPELPLPLRAMSESVVTQWQGSVFVAQITIKEHGDAPG